MTTSVGFIGPDTAAAVAAASEVVTICDTGSQFVQHLVQRVGLLNG